MDQTSSTDIPFDVESYCGEVEKGLSDEQIVLMARPKTLTPLQQELMYWHEKLYHLPYHRLIALSTKASYLRDYQNAEMMLQFVSHVNVDKLTSAHGDPNLGDCVSTDQLI
jgi:hypothetical protein